jgi:hypothetical protein
MDPDPIKIQLFCKTLLRKIIKIVEVCQSYVKKCMQRKEYDCRIRMDPDPISRTGYSQDVNFLHADPPDPGHLNM